MSKNVGNQKQKIDFNDDAFLKSVMKSIPQGLGSKKQGIGSKILGAVIAKPKSIIPMVVVLLYFASCGFVTNIFWIVTLLCKLF